jgi:hypothetical protein
MPEAVTSAPVSTPASSSPAPTSTEPASTRSIIENAIAEIPDRDDDDLPELSNDAELPATDNTPSSSNTSTTTTTADERDELAELLGIAERTGAGKWTSRIAYSKIHKVIGERDAKRKAEHDAALKGHTDKITDYEKRLDAIAHVEHAMFNEPERFIAMLQTIPGYAGYFGGSDRQSRQSTNQRPGPDIRYQDGSTGYSEEGLQRLLDWQAAQVEQRLTKRIAPFEQERQLRAIEAAATPKVQAALEAASKWPLFKENEGDILKALQADQSVSLEQAYQRVVLPKLAADRDKIRQEVLAELNQRPHSTTTRATTGGRSDDAEARSSREIISRIASELTD